MRRRAALLLVPLLLAACRSRLPVTHVPDLLVVVPAAPGPAAAAPAAPATPSSDAVARGVVEYYQISDG